MPLRTLTSAAPLKRRAGEGQLSREGRSPHSHECGPVEAMEARPVCEPAPPSLRTLTSAAPLKPRSARFCAPMRARSLRTLTSAAPLKHGVSVNRFTESVTLRTLTSAAPLKREILARHRQPELRALRTLTSAAPLKRRARACGETPGRALRTLTSAAPLKPFGAILALCRQVASPHSHECGPVEAVTAIMP